MNRYYICYVDHKGKVRVAYPHANSEQEVLDIHRYVMSELVSLMPYSELN